MAQFLATLTPQQRFDTFDHIPPDQFGLIFVRAEESVQEDIADRLDEDQWILALQPLPTDDVAHVLQELRPDVRDRILSRLPEEPQTTLKHILSYPEKTAGSLMQSLLLTLRSDTLIKTVLRYLKLYGPLPKDVHSLFVVDSRNRLVGEVFINDLLSKDSDDTVEAAMQSDVVSIPADMDQQELAHQFRMYDLYSAPVVDAHGKLVGRVTVDDVLDIIQEEAEEDLLLMGGVSADEDLMGSPSEISRKRAVWLGINLMTAFIAASVIKLFDQTLSQLISLAVLMPMVASMGGNAGLQSLTSIIRAMALNQVTAQNVFRIIFKEISAGLLSGMFWGFVTGTVVGWWFGVPILGLVMGLAMVVNLIIAGAFGALIPVTLQKIKIDPALASGVLLTTITDVVGFFSFLGIATLFLKFGWLHAGIG